MKDTISIFVILKESEKEGKPLKGIRRLQPTISPFSLHYGQPLCNTEQLKKSGTSVNTKQFSEREKQTPTSKEWTVLFLFFTLLN